MPGALWVGPLLARPFFGDVGLATGDLRALVPAVAFAVANAALEETSYRGALLGWSTPALGLAGAVIGQAVVFGFAHLGTDVSGPAPLLWLGMAASGAVAGIVAVRSQSLLLPFTRPRGARRSALLRLRLPALDVSRADRAEPEPRAPASSS